MLNFIRGRASDERGGVFMAVMVVIITAMSLVVLANTVERGLNSARVDENRINAFQHANAGIDLALYRIDRGDLPAVTTGNYTPTANGFTDRVVAGTSSFDVVAERIVSGSNRRWKVRSIGTDASGKQRQAIATIEAEPTFRNGFFTDKDFYLTGTQTTPVAYDSRIAGCEDASLDCELDPIPGRLGTNASFIGATATTEEFGERWAGFDMYGRTTQQAADDACDEGNCGTAPKVAAIANKLSVTPPPAPGNVQSCPSGGLVNGGVIQPGDYRCAGLQLQGTITIGTGGNGTGRVRIWVDGGFSASSDAVVNKQKATPKLQIYQAAQANGDPYPGSICGAEIWALLYTPGLSIECTGEHQPKMYGAVVAQLHGGTGNHFDFHWDLSATDLARQDKYVVRDWRECPVSQTNC